MVGRSVASGNELRQPKAERTSGCKFKGQNGGPALGRISGRGGWLKRVKIDIKGEYTDGGESMRVCLMKTASLTIRTSMDNKTICPAQALCIVLDPFQNVCTTANGFFRQPDVEAEIVAVRPVPSYLILFVVAPTSTSAERTLETAMTSRPSQNHVPRHPPRHPHFLSRARTATSVFCEIFHLCSELLACPAAPGLEHVDHRSL